MMHSFDREAQNAIYFAVETCAGAVFCALPTLCYQAIQHSIWM